MNVVPDGYHTVTPWIISRGDTAQVIDFLVAVFDATDLGRMEVNGVIGHAEVLDRAVKLGARVVTEPTELFWGDRVSRLLDPYGNLWWIHQRVAELTEEQMNERLGDPQLAANMEYVQSADFRPRL